MPTMLPLVMGISAASAASAAPAHPNIVWFLTDDQDQVHPRTAADR